MFSPPEISPRVEKIWVGSLLALALILRLSFVAVQQPGFYFFDSVDYDRAARSLLESGHFDRHYAHPPLYPLLMAAAYRVFGFGLIPLRVLQAVLTTGICYCVGSLGRRLFGARAGLLALAGAALFPVHVVLSGIEYPIALGTLLIWMTFLLVRPARDEAPPSTGRLLSAGITAGLAALTFEAGFALVLFLLLWALIRGRRWAGRLRTTAILAVGLLVTVGPWLLQMKLRKDYRSLILRAGVHLPTAPGVDAPLASGQGGDLFRAKVGGMLRNPGFVLRYLGGEFLHFWNPYPDRLYSASPNFRREAHLEDGRMALKNPLVGDSALTLYAIGFSVLLLAAALGAAVALRAVPAAGFLVAWPVVLGLCYAPFFTQTRYRIPADPAFILLGAFAAELVLRRTLGAEVRASLRALWDGWKRVAEKILVVQTFIILLVLFVLVLGPVALLMRLFRKDPMHAEREEGSFWALRERTRDGIEECLRQF